MFQKFLEANLSFKRSVLIFVSRKMIFGKYSSTTLTGWENMTVMSQKLNGFYPYMSEYKRIKLLICQIV